jgi:hypothetical protein
MKKSVLFLLTIFVLSSCTHEIYNTLQWQSKKVTTDGRIPEWSNPLLLYDTKSKINYTISNDRQNLYVCMKISDEISQIKILQSGMEFRIDTLGKKKLPIAFIFPIAGQQVLQKGKSAEKDKKGFSEDLYRSAMKQEQISQTKNAQVIGFKPPLGGFLSLLNTTSGISAAINMDSLGIMYYESIIPFSTFYKNEITAADTNKIFNFEIKVNALPAPSLTKTANDGGKKGGGGMGGKGMGGGGKGGGMKGGGQGSAGFSGNNELFLSNRINVKMKISFK